MKILLPLFPAFAAFGPLFLVIGLPSTSGQPWAAFLGAAMLSFALFALFGLLAMHAKEIAALRDA